MNPRMQWAIVALLAIWASVAIVSLFAPDLVSGSEQEHLPLALLVTWISGAAATRSMMRAMARRTTTGNTPAVIAGVIVVVWAAVAVISVAAPVWVTGSDPTQIPLAALIAPIGGAIASAFVGDLVELMVEAGEPPAGTST